jgi:hypothetical protein
MFRIDTITLQSLCYDLETQYELKPLRKMRVNENMVIFLYTIASGASNSEVQEKNLIFG